MSLKKKFMASHIWPNHSKLGGQKQLQKYQYALIACQQCHLPKEYEEISGYTFHCIDYTYHK